MRNLFQHIKWTEADQKKAMSEGWLLADIDNSGVLEIQACDIETIWNGHDIDTQARRFVANRAGAGDALALKALACIAKVVVTAELEYLSGEAIDYELSLGGVELSRAVLARDKERLRARLTQLRTAL